MCSCIQRGITGISRKWRWPYLHRRKAKIKGPTYDCPQYSMPQIHPAQEIAPSTSSCLSLMLSASKVTSCIISLGGQLQHLITLKPAGGEEQLPLTPQQTLPNVQVITVSSFQNNYLFVLNYSTPPPTAYLTLV